MNTTAKCSRALDSGRRRLCVGIIHPAQPVTPTIAQTTRLTVIRGGAVEKKITLIPRAVHTTPHAPEAA